MTALMKSVDPHAYADIHSGVAMFLTPLGHTCSQLDVPPSHLPPLQSAADRVVRVVGNITNGPGAALLYTAPGTGADFAYQGMGIVGTTLLEVFGGFTSATGRGVTCPRLKAWNDACRKPASADDTTVGCDAECGSSQGLRCKNNPTPRGGGRRAGFVSAARRAGIGAAAARWQASLAEAAAEDPGILVPDGELFWTEFERDREREAAAAEAAAAAAAAAASGDGGGASGRASAAAAGDVPAALRGLEGDELDAALAKRRALRVALTEQLQALVGGAAAATGEEGGAAASAPASGPLPGVAAAGAVAAAEAVYPAWYARDPLMRHYANVTSTERSFFAMFNPMTPGQYRKVVADYATGLLVYAGAAARGPAFG
jgi:hypothetical protein